MAVFLPQFPLQLVVFPNEQLNLHIFEPRYKQLIGECEQHRTTFGIPAFISGAVTQRGTEVELLSVEKRYANGELDIKTRGLGLYEILDFQTQAPNRLYPWAEIRRLEVAADGDYLLNERILNLVRELFELLRLDKALPESPRSFSTFDLGHQVGFSLEQEFELTGIQEEQKRQEFMLEHLERLVPTMREVENMRQRVQMNGHFKHIIPPKI